MRVYNRLNLEGLKELFNGCCILAKAYELESYKLVKDCDIIDNEHYFKLNSAVSSFSAGGTYKFNLECMSDTQKKWYQYYGKAWYCYKLNPSTNKYEEYVEGLGEYKALLDTNTNDRAFLFKEPGRYKITATVFQNSWNPLDGVYGKLNEVETIEINVIDDVDPAIANLGTFKKYIRAIKYANWGEAFGDLAKDIAAIAGTIMLFMGIGILLKKIPAGKLKPFLTKIGNKLKLQKLLTFFGTYGDAFDVAAFVGAICCFDEQVRNAKNDEHLKLAGKTFEKVVETFGLVAVMTFMNVVGHNMSKSDIEKEITLIDSIPDQSVDEDAIVQKYLDKLNARSIKKLTKYTIKGKDNYAYEILKKYEAYFGDDVDFVNELIQKTKRKEIYVNPEDLVENYIAKSNIFEDCRGYTKQIKRLNGTELKKLITDAKKIDDKYKLKNFILDEVLTPAERAASWQGDYPYTGIDKYKDIKLKKGDKIFILESAYEKENNTHSGFATDWNTVEKSGYDSKKLSESLQIKPYYNDQTDIAHAYYRDFATEFTIQQEFLDCAFGEETIANIQFGDGGAPQFFFKKIDEFINKGYLKRGASIKLKNTQISVTEYKKMLKKIK